MWGGKASVPVAGWWRWWQPLAAPDQMMVLTRRAAKKVTCGWRRPVMIENRMPSCQMMALGLRTRLGHRILVSYRSLANYARWRLSLLKALPVSMGCL